MASLGRCTLNRWLNRGGKLGELLGSKDCPAAWNPEGYEKCPLGSILLNVLAQNQEKGWLLLGCVGRLRPWWRDGSCRGDQKRPVWRSRWSPLSHCMAHLCYCMSWSALISDSMYLTFFFPFRKKVLEALCKNLEGKKAVWIQILLYNDVLSTEL